MTPDSAHASINREGTHAVQTITYGRDNPNVDLSDTYQDTFDTVLDYPVPNGGYLTVKPRPRPGYVVFRNVCNLSPIFVNELTGKDKVELNQVVTYARFIDLEPQPLIVEA